MKKSNTKKIRIKNKSIITENIISKKEKDINKLLDTIKLEGAGADNADKVIAIAQDIGKQLQTFALSFKKIYGLVVSYPVDLFKAWYNGESLRKVHNKHADIQRDMSTKLNDITGSMSGAKQLNGFLALTQPHLSIAKYVIENGGAVDKKLQDFSDESRKNINAVLENACYELDIPYPDWAMFDTGEEKHIDYERTTFANAMIDIIEVFEDIKLPDVKNVRNKRLAKKHIANTLKHIQTKLNDIVGDQQRNKLLNDLINGNLPGASRFTEKNREILKRVISYKSNLSNLFKLMHKSQTIYDINSLATGLRDIEKNKENEVLLKGKTRRSSSSGSKKEKTEPKSNPEASPEPEASPKEDIQSSYVRKNKILSIKNNNILIKESEEESDKVVETEDTEAVLGFLSKGIQHLFGGIMFSDAFMLYLLHQISAQNSLLYITSLHNLLDVFDSNYNSVTLMNKDLFNNINDASLEKELKDKLERFKKFVDSYSEELIVKMVPELSGIKSDYIAEINEQESTKEKNTKKINEIKNSCVKISEDLKNANSDSSVTISESDQNKLKNLKNYEEFLKSLISTKDSLNQLQKDIQLAINLDDSSIKAIIENYNNDKDFIDDFKNNILSSTIDNVKIEIYNNIKKGLASYLEKVNKMDIVKKVEDRITRISQELQALESALNVPKSDTKPESDSSDKDNSTSTNNSKDADTGTDTSADETKQ